ncbi:MAG: DUF47 domain-containing protein [Fervidobacterium sp.]
MAISFAKKENEVIQKLIELSNKTVEATVTLKEYFLCYFSKECDKKKELFLQIKRIEHESDEIRRWIISETYKGLFLPDMREVIHSLAEQIDKIVNKCESVSKIIDYQQPNVPEPLQEKIIVQLNCSVNAADAFAKSVAELFKNIDNVNVLILEVEKSEHDEDMIEEVLLKEVFTLNLNLSEKMQLKELIINIGDIVDRTEDASDILEVLLLKLAY